MRSKVVFLLLFMLSFTVMHDTVINLLDNDKNILVSHYASAENQSDDVLDVHDMFHFMALVTSLTPVPDRLESEQTLSAYLFQYTLTYLENSTKPPIA